MNATATATTKKTVFSKYNVVMTSSDREGLLIDLAHDRRSLYGHNSNYNPNLGNRRHELMQACASKVIRLVLNKKRGY